MPLNLERIAAVLAAIEANPDHFDMAHWLMDGDGVDHGDINFNFKHEFDGLVGNLTDGACGTSACIAGWACSIYPKEAVRLARENSGSVTFFDAAADMLGLTEHQAIDLFHIRGNEKAIATLRAIVERGEWVHPHDVVTP